MWRERIVQQTGQPAQFRTFRAFVEAPPPEGLHTSVEMLIDICNRYKDMEAVHLLSQESAGKAGGNNNPMGLGGKSHKQTDIVNHNNITLVNATSKAMQGTSTIYNMRRLAKSSPELHAKVIAGELSPNAAAVQAGFRSKPLQVPDDPERAARWFISHKDAGWLATFVAELVKG